MVGYSAAGCRTLGHFGDRPVDFRGGADGPLAIAVKFV